MCSLNCFFPKLMSPALSFFSKLSIFSAQSETLKIVETAPINSASFTACKFTLTCLTCQQQSMFQQLISWSWFPSPSDKKIDVSTSSLPVSFRFLSFSTFRSFSPSFWITEPLMIRAIVMESIHTKFSSQHVKFTRGIFHNVQFMAMPMHIKRFFSFPLSYPFSPFLFVSEPFTTPTLLLSKFTLLTDSAEQQQVTARNRAEWQQQMAAQQCFKCTMLQKADIQARGLFLHYSQCPHHATTMAGR